MTLLRRALIASVAFAFVASFADTADAQSRKSKRQATAATKTSKTDTKAPFGDIPKGPLQMVVSIGQQHATLYSNGVRIAQTPVSTGTRGHETPMGVFSVIEKDRYHHSNLYNNAPMYYMHRLTWSGVAMHEGMLPGYAASHGCIRMPTGFVSRLWLISKLGVRVVVARNDVAPYEFAHAKLFKPKPKPPEAQVSELRPLDELRPTLAANETTTGAGSRPIQMAQATTTATDAGKGADMGDQLPELPDPISEATPLVPAEPAPVTSATETSAEPSPVQQTEAVEPVAPAEVETTASTPAGEAPKPAAAPTLEAPKPAAAPMPAAVEPASNEPEKAVPAGNEPYKAAPSRTKTAEPTKHSGHVAVFVSKKEKKIFVRQGFVPLFEMPIGIENPDQPLGTHVFTAMEVLDNGSGMRWNAISVPSSTEPPRNETGGRKNGKKQEPAPKKPAEVKPASTAAQTLDRIQMPPEAVERISEILTPGSSLVVSDEGLGRETGRYTDFIVLTR